VGGSVGVVELFQKDRILAHTERSSVPRPEDLAHAEANGMRRPRRHAPDVSRHEGKTCATVLPRKLIHERRQRGILPGHAARAHEAVQRSELDADSSLELR